MRQHLLLITGELTCSPGHSNGKIKFWKSYGMKQNKMFILMVHLGPWGECFAIILTYVYVCACVLVSVPTCLCAQRPQEDSLELELQSVWWLMWMLGSELQFSARAVCGLNGWAVSLALTLNNCKKNWFLAVLQAKSFETESIRGVRPLL